MRSKAELLDDSLNDYMDYRETYMYLEVAKEAVELSLDLEHELKEANVYKEYDIPLPEDSRNRYQRGIDRLLDSNDKLEKEKKELIEYIYNLEPFINHDLDCAITGREDYKGTCDCGYDELEIKEFDSE